MKAKHLFLVLMLLSLSAPTYGLDFFNIDIVTSATAGDWLGITITAVNAGSGTDTTFNGTVNFSTTTGPGTFYPAVSGNFTAGEWKGGIQFFAASNYLSLTCTSASGATGTATIDIDPTTADGLIMIVPDQTYTPGIYPGVSPSNPSQINLLEANWHPVTIYVTDYLENWVDNYGGTTITVNMAGNGSVLPSTQQYTENGRAFFSISFDVTGLTTISYINSPPDSFSNTRQVTVNSANEIWAYAKVPTQALAGQLFGITFTASTLDNYDPYDPYQDPEAAASANGKSFKIHLFPNGSTTVTALGQWQPNDEFEMGSSYLGIPPGDGRYFGEYSYNRAEYLYLQAEKNFPEPMIVTPMLSRRIEILPNLPNHLHASVSPQLVQSKNLTTITVLAHDQYHNTTRSSLHNFVIRFSQEASGHGELLAAQVSTNNNGVAQCSYRAGPINEEVTIACEATNTLTAQVYAQASVSVQVSVTKPERGAIVNFPNPFNPGRNETTEVSYYLEQASDVEIRIYDPFGRLVLSRDFKKDAGDFISQAATSQGGAFWRWDGRNGEKRIVANGIYFLKITSRSSAGTQEFKRRVGVLK